MIEKLFDQGTKGSWIHGSDGSAQDRTTSYTVGTSAREGEAAAISPVRPILTTDQYKLSILFGQWIKGSIDQARPRIPGRYVPPASTSIGILTRGR